LWILRVAFPRREDPAFDALAEFDRQLENLLTLGYPRHAGVTPIEFTRRIEPLKELLTGRDEALQQVHKLGRIPFVIVIRQELVSADRAIRLVKHRGNTGFSVIEPYELRWLEPIPTVALPDGTAYLLIDIDLGWETRNVAADEAQKQIEARGRSPLTVEEGIALVTHHPETLAINAWFSLPGSRRGESQITSIRISKDRPKLGWWAAGKPNIWLGCPSCHKRLGSTTALNVTS
jgi:hypothetical protein